MIRQSVWSRELPPALHALQSEFNRLFEDYWSRNGSAPAEDSPTELKVPSWIPAVDLHETSSELILEVDLPGVDPTTIDLSLTGPVLSIRGERSPAEHSDGNVRARERPVGSFLRQLTLAEEVDFDRVQAEAKHGVLTVRLPKREAAKPRTIPISS